MKIRNNRSFPITKLLVMEVPQKFPFPFTPYEIQENFMKNLWTCLENGNLGIFESPTGTGKSLSIICGALKWLTDREAWVKENLLNKIAELDKKLEEVQKKNVNDWFTEQTEQIQLNTDKRAFLDKLEAIERRNDKKQKYSEKLKQAEDFKKKAKFKSQRTRATEKNENQDSKTAVPEEKNELDDDLLLEELCLNSDGSDNEESENEPAKYTQIFFCSRTHSQLSQFVGELQRSPYSEEVSLVPIASR